MDKIVVTLTKSKETQGTHVYANKDEGMSIYIPKSKVKGNVPLKVVLTVEPAGGVAPQAAEPEM